MPLPLLQKQRATEMGVPESGLRVLKAVDWFRAQHGWGPTTREIMELCGWRGPARVAQVKDVLVARGMIVDGGKGTGRSIALTPMAKAVLRGEPCGVVMLSPHKCRGCGLETFVNARLCHLCKPLAPSS